MRRSSNPRDRQAIKALLATPTIARAVRIHNAFRNLTILSLYSLARTKGVLTTASFIWLRPVNRSLFCLLNNYGRKTCWIEVAGAWSRYWFEEACADRDADYSARKHRFEKVSVQNAVDELETMLVQDGWVIQDAAEAVHERGSALPTRMETARI